MSSHPDFNDQNRSRSISNSQSSQDLPWKEAFDRERHLKVFGKTIRRRRTDLELSQERASERAGLHRNYVGGVERGERNISLVNILKLASALELGVSELMERYEAELRMIEEFGD